MPVGALHTVESIQTPGMYNACYRLNVPGAWLYMIDTGPSGAIAAPVPQTAVALAEEADCSAGMHEIEGFVIAGAVNNASRMRVPGGWIYWTDLGPAGVASGFVDRATEN